MTWELIASLLTPMVSAIATIFGIVYMMGRKEAANETIATNRAQALDENTAALKTLTEKMTDHAQEYAGHKAEVNARLKAMDREISDLKGGSGCQHPTLPTRPTRKGR